MSRSRARRQAAWPATVPPPPPPPPGSRPAPPASHVAPRARVPMRAVPPPPPLPSVPDRALRWPDTLPHRAPADPEAAEHTVLYDSISDEELFPSRRTLPPATGTPSTQLPALRAATPWPSADVSGIVPRGWRDQATAVVASAGATPLGAMDRQEHSAARAYTLTASSAAVVGLLLLPFSGGDPAAKAVLAASLVVLAASQGAYFWVLRQPGAYALQRSLVFAVPNVLAALALCWFFGPTSGCIVFIPPALHHFSLKRDEQATILVYVSVSVSYLLLSTLILLEVIPDVGLDASHAGTFDRWCMVMGAELGFAMTFVLARRTRRTIVEAMEDHGRALHDLAKREALLAEARQDLEQALATGGLGRFTDSRLGSFVLGKVIGRGGMGEVYEARHVRSGERAAVKMLHADALSDPRKVRRFLREARTVSELRSPYVARVLEVGGTDAPLPYIAMEHLDGEILSDRLRERPRLGWAAVVDLVRQVGAGLAVAHGRGVVHRDVKPRNLFLCRGSDGRALWKVLDFGISQLSAGMVLETQGRLVGTPAFMAPEQVRGGEVGPLADLFSLAAVAYRCLTGRPAFSGPTIPDLLHEVVHASAPPPSAAGLPEDLDLVMTIALAKRPQDRFASADELADALEGAFTGSLPPAVRARAERLAQ